MFYIPVAGTFLLTLPPYYSLLCRLFTKRGHILLGCIARTRCIECRCGRLLHILRGCVTVCLTEQSDELHKTLRTDGDAARRADSCGPPYCSASQRTRQTSAFAAANVDSPCSMVNPDDCKGGYVAAMRAFAKLLCSLVFC